MKSEQYISMVSDPGERVGPSSQPDAAALLQRGNASTLSHSAGGRRGSFRSSLAVAGSSGSSTVGSDRTTQINANKAISGVNMNGPHPNLRMRNSESVAARAIPV